MNKLTLLALAVIGMVAITTSDVKAGSGYISNGFCEARQMIYESGSKTYNALAVRGKVWYVAGRAVADVAKEKYYLGLPSLRCSECFAGTDWDYDYDDADYIFSNGYCWGHLMLDHIYGIITVGYPIPIPRSLWFKVYL